MNLETKKNKIIFNKYMHILIKFFTLVIGILWFMLGVTSLFRLSIFGKSIQVYWDSLGGIAAELSLWAILIGSVFAWIMWNFIYKYNTGKIGYVMILIGIILLTISIFVSCSDVNNVYDSVNKELKVKPVSDTSERVNAMVFPLKQDFSGLKKINDISYGPYGANNTLDLIMSSDTEKKNMPILLQVHGGGMTSGEKSMESMPLLLKMAKSGWLVATINYRLGPDNKWPAQIDDVNQAIYWLQQHASEYGGDSGFITGVGGSAGGYLLSLAAVSSDEISKEGDYISPLKAVVSLYATYDMFKINVGTESWKNNILPQDQKEDKELWKRVSPIYHIKENTPPFYIIHGKIDGLAFIDNAQEFVKELRNKSKNTVIYTELAGAHHGFDNQNSLRVIGVNEGIEKFLEFEYNRYLELKK